MAAPTGRYLGLTSAELAALRVQLVNARTAILTAGQNYSRPGMSMGRVSYADLKDEFTELAYAEAIVNNTGTTVTYADLR